MEAQAPHSWRLLFLTADKLKRNLHGAYVPPARCKQPELEEDFEVFVRILGFVPNSLLTMQRRPEMVRGFAALTRSIMDPEGDVDLGFMRLVAHFASRAAGCQYCEAHSLIAAEIHGISQAKIDADLGIPEQPAVYRGRARGAGLCAGRRFGAQRSGCDTDGSGCSEHWSEQQIVQILGAVCLYGFLNRWNDSMATELEDAPRRMGERVLARGGWTGGKHVAES